ncbi:hypothetical protein [Streptomyces lunaelactis]|uniref:hypothetical protein n=1 Tax=Streptomyces lunaelactis TaxID=1535768 RepID=UPI00131EDF06|nr:hypothetical protein [Streptomyces lunaelactis]NUK89618.1 hypothetical protein [Streptomyces lunaelactis]
MNPTTARFITSATALPAEALAVLYEEFLERWRHGCPPRRTPRSTTLSDRRCSRVPMNWSRSARVFTRSARPPDAIAARAVHKRVKLTKDQYRALLDPFTAASVPVPDRDN